MLTIAKGWTWFCATGDALGSLSLEINTGEVKAI